MESTPSQTVERRQVRYSGHVQGVGFRATARSLAQGRPLSGWVRNEPDGTVLLEVQGPPVEVHRFLDDLRKTMGSLIRGERQALLPPAAESPGLVIRH